MLPSDQAVSCRPLVRLKVKSLAVTAKLKSRSGFLKNLIIIISETDCVLLLIMLMLFYVVVTNITNINTNDLFFPM